VSTSFEGPLIHRFDFSDFFPVMFTEPEVRAGSELLTVVAYTYPTAALSVLPAKDRVSAVPTTFPVQK
jgi:hypothetical protein